MKKHKILILAIISYLGVFIYDSSLVMVALEGSKYYFLEMLQILPAVFILTSMIQTWVPTSVIMKYFGNGSGIKGISISLLIGSLSAGPIYAAFPVCQTLLKKGASIKNIVIILSAWAVIKVPMLINEVKFLGFQYMLVRWVLTLIAILIMATIVDRVVKREDLPSSHNFKINHTTCVLCEACLKEYPNTFGLDGKKIIIKKDELTEEEVNSCPMGAIQ